VSQKRCTTSQFSFFATFSIQLLHDRGLKRRNANLNAKHDKQKDAAAAAAHVEQVIGVELKAFIVCLWVDTSLDQP
jgi:hypothetical protein